MEITIKLQGNLKRFGNEFKINADKIKEGMSSLLTQIAGFRLAIQRGEFHVIVGDKDLTNDSIFPNFDEVLTEDTTVTLIPAIRGSKGNMGVFSIVIGVVLIAASWYAGGAAGWGYLGAQGFAGATATFMAGVAMIASGVATMLAPTPKMGDLKTGEDKEKRSSTSFSNTANMVAQGHPVPIAVGEIMTGSLTISKGLKTFTVNKYVPEERKKRGRFGLGRR